MKKNKQHHAVTFALRYSGSSTDYLTAGAALSRAHELLDDAKKIADLFEKHDPFEQRLAPWVGAEIVSYYSVGLVTCLEWHTRSRLVDLLTFYPNAFGQEDVRVIREKVLIDVISSNVTVAAAVGAATKISKLDDYINVFRRIFSSFGLEEDPYKILTRNSEGEESCTNDEIIRLNDLFLFRGNLVHEIGIERVGHPNVRDRWDPSVAIMYSTLALKVIQLIEKAISANAPADFPNLLDEQGIPISKIDIIIGKIQKYEEELNEKTKDISCVDPEKYAIYMKAQTAAHDYIKSGIDFIENFVMHSTYIDIKSEHKIALLKNRMEFLESMIEDLDLT